MKNEIPFNDWSKKAIKKGHKFMTSRHKKYTKDNRVKSILPKTEWGFIRDNYWYLEGAESPEELQKVIDNIYKRKVEDDELFYPHIGNFKPLDSELLSDAENSLYSDEVVCLKCHKAVKIDYVQDNEKCSHCGKFMELEYVN